MKHDLKTDSVCALLIGNYDSDRPVIQEVFNKLGWRLLEARDRQRSMQWLARKQVQVVISETELPDCNWKRLLHDLRSLIHPPQLIVTSPHADDYLWAEALNVGAYDVLSRPLERSEVERVIMSARRHYDFQPERAGRAPLQMTGLA